MEANPVRVIQYFDGSKQSIIPLFQRPYTWQQENWEVLWADIMGQYELGATDTAHFMGAIVSVPARTLPVGVSKHLVIDGQQRLTTIALLLCSLRSKLDPQGRGRVERLFNKPALRRRGSIEAHAHARRPRGICLSRPERQMAEGKSSFARGC